MRYSAHSLIETLQLAKNPDGGLYRQIHEVAGMGDHRRSLVTVIHYLLTPEDAIAYFHRMSADAVHYFQMGAPMRVYMISPSGDLQIRTLGPDVRNGESFQVVVPGGTWKALELSRGPYSLISEAVSPGWIPQDNETATRPQMLAECHGLPAELEKLIRAGGEP